MANEAVLRYSSGNPGDIQDYTVADTYSIEKGTLLQLVDPRAVSGAVIVSAPIAGIAAREKIANDGRTRISVHRKGDFDMYASGAITLGAPVKSASTVAFPNYVMAAVSADSGATIIGYSLETASDGEVVQIRLNL